MARQVLLSLGPAAREAARVESNQSLIIGDGPISSPAVLDVGLATAIGPTRAINDVNLARDECQIIVNLAVALGGRHTQSDSTRLIRPGLGGTFDGADPLVVAQVVDDFNVVDVAVWPWTPIGSLGQLAVILV